jgi:hypothetical protein
MWWWRPSAERKRGLVAHAALHLEPDQVAPEDQRAVEIGKVEMNVADAETVRDGGARLAGGG